jgi:hypothetical protein
MLTIEAEGFPGMTLIMGGTLDVTIWVKPTVQLFCDSAQPWVAISRQAEEGDITYKSPDVVSHPLNQIKCSD